jgi:hypothetical protein
MWDLDNILYFIFSMIRLTVSLPEGGTQVVLGPSAVQEDRLLEQSTGVMQHAWPLYYSMLAALRFEVEHNDRLLDGIARSHLGSDN